MLAAFSQQATPVERGVDELNAEDIGRLVAAKGWLASVKESRSHVFLTLCEHACVKAVVFSRVAGRMREKSLDPALLKPGQFVLFRGVVTEYEGELELVAKDAAAIDVLS